jgi:hypothetical protein
MVTRKALIVGTVWALSLVGATLWAQGGRGALPQQPPAAPLDTSRQVLSGDNIGLRISDVQHSSTAVEGTLVVKVNGQWVEVAFVPRLVR